MRKTKAEKGITLVALIITIIVLLILAVVAINAVRNDGIIDYAKNARNEYEKAQTDEQSTLYYYLSQVETTQGVHNGIIPKDGKYTKAGETTPLKEGTEFPIVQSGDVYAYGDYEYCYNSYYNTAISPNEWVEYADPINGWGVRVLDTEKEKYGEILITINGANIKSLYTTFKNCKLLTVAPSIPSTVTDMSGTFLRCSELITAPIIPNGVINMQQTFRYCTKLANVSDIPNSVTILRNTFQDCINLTTVPEISDNVIDMELTFGGCTQLVSAPKIPEKVENMNATFQYCSALKVPPEIPDSVTSMHNTFYGCTTLNLTSVFAIPEKVTDVYGTFSGCKNLAGDILIKTSLEKVTNYDFCFALTEKEITLYGVDGNKDKTYDNYSLLEKLVGTSNSGKISINDLKSNQ